jgi:hypothetical protein
MQTKGLQEQEKTAIAEEGGRHRETNARSGSQRLFGPEIRLNPWPIHHHRADNRLDSEARSKSIAVQVTICKHVNATPTQSFDLRDASRQHASERTGLLQHAAPESLHSHPLSGSEVGIGTRTEPAPNSNRNNPKHCLFMFHEILLNECT